MRSWLRSLPGLQIASESRFEIYDIELDLPEAAALMSSLAVLGPTVSDSAASAMRKLVTGLRATADGMPAPP